MENIALIGIDLGKNSFHIHCQDRRGKAVYRKKFTRPKLIEFLATCPATTIAMEACGGSHFMARKLEELGHSPKLISPQFVRPFVKSNKNDFVDAEAICEAASRPSMRFVQPRTESQQAMRALHRVRESLVQDKVKTTNRISKRGNKKIRTLLVQCARVFIQKLEHQSGKLADWVRDLLCRKSNFVVTCALANKLARIAWALTARQQTYVA
ncbi:IS110 family transposase [Klebsiella pneumoniae]|uniref:IS110 family transposase n=1 Tax=Klebsiella pneumoniae TaxID=573 RepID=UPI0019402CBF|nr:IS110 family transposase [Klebsiella pneumoniae]MBM5730137.1 IS110 family transposase [Klebsiella pneumoniae]